MVAVRTIDNWIRANRGLLAKSYGSPVVYRQRVLSILTTFRYYNFPRVDYIDHGWVTTYFGFSKGRKEACISLNFDSTIEVQRSGSVLNLGDSHTCDYLKVKSVLVTFLTFRMTKLHEFIAASF